MANPPRSSTDSKSTPSPTSSTSSGQESEIHDLAQSFHGFLVEQKEFNLEQRRVNAEHRKALKTILSVCSTLSDFLGSLHEFQARTVAATLEGEVFAKSVSIQSLEDAFLWYRDISKAKNDSSVAAGTSRLAHALQPDVHIRMLKDSWGKLVNSPNTSRKVKQFLRARPWVDANVMSIANIDECIDFLRKNPHHHPLASQLTKWKEPVGPDVIGTDERGLALALWSVIKDQKDVNMTVPFFPSEELEFDLQGKIFMLDSGITVVRMGEIQSSASGIAKAVNQLCIRLAFSEWVIRALQGPNLTTKF